MDEHREGIQAEKPVPPWEQPGCFRMDCEPHRGELLKGMAIAGMIIGQASMCLPLSLVIGIPLSVTTWYLARLDLAKMSQGLMDPDGQEIMIDAKCAAVFALAIDLIWTAIWAMLLLVLG